jgi:small subunit ribosomal protein S6
VQVSLKPNKGKKSMKNYEITFITKEEPKDLVKSILETFGGKITKTSSMGQKTFVYPIKKEKSGIYTTYLFEMDPEQMQAFNRKLDMEEEVLRHLVVFIKPSQEMAAAQSKEIASLLDEKPTEEIEVAPETAIVVEEEKAIEIAPEEAIVAIEEKVEEEKTEEPVKVKKTVKKAAKTAPVTEEVVAEKPVKAKKAVKKEAKAVEGVNEAANNAVNEVINEEERLEALDKKLEELLKD